MFINRYQHDGNISTSFAYTYNANKNKLTETDNVNTNLSQNFNYDHEERLTSWSSNGSVLNQNQSWNLSLEGAWNSTTKNGVTESRTFDVTNALLSQQVGNQTTNLNYDLDGNLKNDSKFHYAFDAFQRIVEVKDQSQNLVAKYQMDTSNRRISKTVGTTVHRTVYAGWQVAEEHETVPSGKKFKTTTKVYVYGQYIDEPLVMQITKPNGNRKKYWYLRNQQYSIYALTNDNGKIVEAYHYSAYGELEIKDADGSTLTESAYSNSYFYTGRLLDQETGLFYFRARYYDAKLGQFISRDPLTYVDGMSLYRGYFAVNGVDWSGRDDIRVINGNQVQYMPEGWFGWDLVDQAVIIGTVDDNNVVTFNPELGLRDMSLKDAQRYGGEDSYGELLEALKKAQENAAKNNGGDFDATNPAFYSDLAVSKEECRREGVEAAEQLCRARILKRSSVRLILENVAFDIYSGIAGVAIDALGGYMLLQRGNPWGSAVLVVGGALSIYSANNVISTIFAIQDGAMAAIDRYCECDCKK